MKIIKHNDLLPWFLEDHARLPASYIKSCDKFFRELGIKTESNKLQAASLTNQIKGLYRIKTERKKMKKYQIVYSEHAVYLKTFEGKDKEAAHKAAYDELSNNGWDTTDWDIGTGEGGQISVEGELILTDQKNNY